MGYGESLGTRTTAIGNERMHEPKITELVNRVKKRAKDLFLWSDEMVAEIDEQEKKLNESDLLWHWFSIILQTPKNRNESLLTRMSSPWNSQDEEIQEFWKYLTRPENLPFLQERAKRTDINESALETTRMALRQAMNRPINKD